MARSSLPWGGRPVRTGGGAGKRPGGADWLRLRAHARRCRGRSQPEAADRRRRGRGAVRRGPSGRARRSDGADVLRLRALLALRDVELDLLALVEGAVAVGRDGGVVAEDVG